MMLQVNGPTVLQEPVGAPTRFVQAPFPPSSIEHVELMLITEHIMLPFGPAANATVQKLLRAAPAL